MYLYDKWLSFRANQKGRNLLKETPNNRMKKKGEALGNFVGYNHDDVDDFKFRGKAA